MSDTLLLAGLVCLIAAMVLLLRATLYALCRLDGAVRWYAWTGGLVFAGVLCMEGARWLTD